MKSKKNHYKLILNGLFCLFSGSALFLLLHITQLEVAAESQDKISYGYKDLVLAARLNQKAQEYFQHSPSLETLLNLEQLIHPELIT